jgi:glycosyltransferase involved in cell wall biosynthesis
MISILILTLNEEADLPRCLDALQWCDDIVVMDSFSTDRTIEIARVAGVRVVQRAFDSFAGQRNFALQNVPFHHDWVLHLDADEVCTEPLRIEIQQTIPEPQFDAYRIPSKMIFMGRWLRFAGMYPTYQVRLGRYPEFRFKQVGHGQREDIEPARVGTLKEPYLHYSFSKGLGDWFDKHNRYSTLEAHEILKNRTIESIDLRGLFSIADSTRRRRALKQLTACFSFRPMLRFLYMYFICLGFLDGRAGYRYCRLLAMYEAMIEMKVLELRLRIECREV